MGKIISGGYIQIQKLDHPRAGLKGRSRYISEHVLVMEESIGRYLNDDEVVHHIDLNKQNNSLDNLQLMSRIDHNKLHAKLKPKKMIEVTCNCCHEIFSIELRNYKSRVKKGQENFYCNRSCMGKIQGLTANKKTLH